MCLTTLQTFSKRRHDFIEIGICLWNGGESQRMALSETIVSTKKCSADHFYASRLGSIGPLMTLKFPIVVWNNFLS